MTTQLDQDTHILQPEAVGATLRLIQTSQPSERWYQAARAQAEVVFWVGHDGRTEHMQVFFGSSVVEWSRTSGLRTGSLYDGTATKGVRYKEIDRFAPDANVAGSTVSFVRRMLLASEVEPSLYEHIFCHRAPPSRLFSHAPAPVVVHTVAHA